MPASYVEQIPLSKRVGGQLNIAVNLGLLANTDPASSATVTLLKAKIDTNLASLNADLAPEAEKTQLALQKGVDLGLFNETHSQTTVAAIVALTDASTTHTQGFFA